jgi:hypothetical protein
MTENVNKNWIGSSDLPGERLYVDISSIKERRIREMLNGANLEGELRDMIWVECLMNILIIYPTLSRQNQI